MLILDSTYPIIITKRISMLIPYAVVFVRYVLYLSLRITPTSQTQTASDIAEKLFRELYVPYVLLHC
jgi:hypothetical protein